MNNGKVVVAESIKPELMKMLQEATLKKGGELTFNEVKADLDMPDPNCYAPYFGTFQAAAKKAWQTAKGILAQRGTETGKIAGTERKEDMAKRGTGAKAGRRPRYTDEQIRDKMKLHFESCGELPDLATFKRDHPDVTIQPDRFREIVRLTEPDVLGWIYKGTSGDTAVDSEAAGDGVVSESEEPIEVPEEVFEESKMADSATSAEVADPEENVAVEAPQGEVVAIDSGAEPESEELEGSGAILAPEEPTEEAIVGPKTADFASGEGSGSEKTPDDDGELKEVDSAEKPKKADGKTIPALGGFYGYGGVASCCLSGDNYSISPNIMSCGGKRSMELKLCTIPAMDGGSIDLSVAISGDRDPSSTTPCDNGSDLCVVMKDAMTTFHVKGMGLSEYSLNRSVRNKRASLTITTIKRSLKIVFENCSVITVRDDVVDNTSGEFALAIEATVGAICVYGGCESEVKSDSTEDPHNA